ncbi:hypothetical protein QTG56_24025 (plasmid) [Rossellomorea sp. AcN35-11]|nr:hypothetical protein [Rossellomorea aquimaris]WJV31707.1 hypothetical protein QTG56_24025 [Rossellomorea sp. AcN35-11]
MNKFLLISIISVILLAACDGDESTVEPSMPKGFELVTEDKLDVTGYAEVYRHKVTGCHYLVVSGMRTVSAEQMFVSKNGVSVPYCDN